jgi:hypothetical protein
MAVVTSPPHITSDEREWFIHTGGKPAEGNRRPLKPGEHVAVDCPLVLEYPGCFTPSREPVDTWPQGILTREATERRRAEQQRLSSYPCEKVTQACARCGFESEHSVILLDAPTQTDLVSALAELDDHDPESWSKRWTIENKLFGLAKAVMEQQAERERLKAEFRTQHPTCPEGTPPLPEPGKAPEDVPLLYRLPAFRTAR